MRESQNGEPNLQYSNASRTSLEKEKLTDPSRRSLRRAFLLKRLCLLLATYTLNAVYWLILTLYHPVKYSNFDATNQTYFHHFYAVSARETLLRAGLTVHFVWEAWGLITSYHNALAIVFVSLGLDEPRDWPPIYGSISETYTIGRFRGNFLASADLSNVQDILRHHLGKLPTTEAWRCCASSSG